MKCEINNSETFSKVKLLIIYYKLKNIIEYYKWIYYIFRVFIKYIIFLLIWKYIILIIKIYILDLWVYLYKGPLCTLINHSKKSVIPVDFMKR